ncbi:regulatory protein GemA [Novosphingobium sp.]|uniref:regulatory protein GemA n=1 Tax=Novosphingobium sp. TaxID=1874826 RepID=UPI0027372341|nr:regulatory protein GemA [Novosphingobium sp.]MDP3908712.1 regulatory protein GemA [Novosphingobium sp.]
MDARKRIALVHIAKAKLQMSDEEYRKALADYADVCSAAQLTDAGFDRLMAYFRSLGFVSDARRTQVTDKPQRGTASQAQIDMIVALWVEVTDGTSIRQLEAWIERHHGISALRFVTGAKAQKIIGSLQLWKRRLREKGARA